jgi:hypothetical protein
VIVLAGVAGGLGLYLWGGARYQSAVGDMARAPVGCTTTLRFTETGRFWMYSERRGELSQAPGDCDAATSWDIDGELPRVALELVGADGDAASTTRDSSRSYDVGAFTGTSVRSTVITEPGTYTLRVDARSGGFAVAVGRDPAGAGSVLRNLGVMVAAIAVVVAVFVLIIGSRRPSRPTGLAVSEGAAGSPWAPPVWSPPPAPLPPPSSWPPGGS